MKQGPDQMLKDGLIAPIMVPLDAFRILYQDAIVPGAFWYFTRRPYPAKTDGAFTLVGYIPPARSCKP